MVQHLAERYLPSAIVIPSQPAAAGAARLARRGGNLQFMDSLVRVNGAGGAAVRNAPIGVLSCLKETEVA